MEKIAELIRAQTGIDFSGYKPSTVMRRLARNERNESIVTARRTA
jgi:chemotaxis methyl-accepting protein methylase